MTRAVLVAALLTVVAVTVLVLFVAIVRERRRNDESRRDVEGWVPDLKPTGANNFTWPPSVSERPSTEDKS